MVGFDNIPESALVNPPLTTITQPLQRMGAEALRLLVDLIAGVAVGMIAVYSALTGEHQLLRVAMGLALISFLGTVAVARYLPDGTPDRDFGEGGWLTTDFGPGHDRAAVRANAPGAR